MEIENENLHSNLAEVRKIPFPALQEGKAFDRQMTLEFSLRVEALLSELIPAENTQSYSHGVGFAFKREDLSVGEGDFLLHQATNEISVDSFMSNDIPTFLNFLETFAQKFSGEMKRFMYERIGEEVEAVGNTVDFRDTGSIADSYLEMLQKIEYGVDKKGNVTFPELRLHPDMGRRVEAEFQKQKPEFFQKIEKLEKQKIALALKNESERLAKFTT